MELAQFVVRNARAQMEAIHILRDDLLDQIPRDQLRERHVRQCGQRLDESLAHQHGTRGAARVVRALLMHRPDALRPSVVRNLRGGAQPGACVHHRVLRRAKQRCQLRDLHLQLLVALLHLREIRFLLRLARRRLLHAGAQLRDLLRVLRHQVSRIFCAIWRRTAQRRAQQPRQLALHLLRGHALADGERARHAIGGLAARRVLNRRLALRRLFRHLVAIERCAERCALGGRRAFRGLLGHGGLLMGASRGFVGRTWLKGCVLEGFCTHSRLESSRLFCHEGRTK
mmetsp:Transcript_21759/g.49828  ORF Transcript_21759/g.49828 Transcript_21759/m.49828 type:complete len:285 (+) Transcript_21759:1566-2420(+)